MNTWGQWGAGAPTAAAPFQAASFPTPPVPPVPPAAAAAAPPGFPVGGYPFYGASATMPGVSCQMKVPYEEITELFSFTVVDH